MSTPSDKRRRYSGLLNMLMILCIPVGLLFFGAMVGYQMSYEDFDCGSRLAEGRLSGHDMRIVHNLGLYSRAMLATICVFITLLIVRVRLAMVAKRNVSKG